MKRAELPLLLVPPSECSYLEDQFSSSAFVDPNAPMSTRLYGQLLRLGFRRSGRLVYRPHCETCQQCRSVRIPVEEFTPRRRHRRIQQRNAEVEIVPGNARFQAEHYALYQRYTASRHAGGSMADSDEAEYMSFLQADWCDTQFVELRENGQLLGVAVTDQLEDGLSAVYTFFEPELPDRSLGAFAILAQISLAKRLGLPYLYLGYWVRDCDKMRYKTDYRPIEVHSEGRWRRFLSGENVSIPELPQPAS